MNGKTAKRRLEATSGVVLFLGLLVVAGGCRWLAPFDPWLVTGDPLRPPDSVHWLGTNDLGQDVLSEVLFGMQVSLVVGMGAAGLSTLIGTLVGLAAESLRGTTDEVLMGVSDVLMVIPGLPLVIVLVAYTGPGTAAVILAIGLTWWPATARAVRAQAMLLREMPFVEAARASGLGEMRVMLQHILRNATPVVLARFAVALPDAILAEAGLSFLGLSDPSQKSLGMTVNYAFQGGAFLNGHWWWHAPAILAIALMVTSVTLASECSLLGGGGMMRRSIRSRREAAASGG